MFVNWNFCPAQIARHAGDRHHNSTLTLLSIMFFCASIVCFMLRMERRIFFSLKCLGTKKVQFLIVIMAHNREERKI